MPDDCGERFGDAQEEKNNIPSLSQVLPPVSSAYIMTLMWQNALAILQDIPRGRTVQNEHGSIALPSGTRFSTPCLDIILSHNMLWLNQPVLAPWLTQSAICQFCCWINLTSVTLLSGHASISHSVLLSWELTGPLTMHRHNYKETYVFRLPFTMRMSEITAESNWM